MDLEFSCSSATTVGRVDDRYRIPGGKLGRQRGSSRWRIVRRRKNERTRAVAASADGRRAGGCNVSGTLATGEYVTKEQATLECPPLKHVRPLRSRARENRSFYPRDCYLHVLFIDCLAVSGGGRAGSRPPRTLHVRTFAAPPAEARLPVIATRQRAIREMDPRFRWANLEFENPL